MSMTQANRTAALVTPLGDDQLLLKSMTFTEGVGRPFQLDLELLSEDQAINFDDLIGQNVTLRLPLPDGATRYVNGYISRFVQSTSPGRLVGYQATVVPWLWFLSRTADCRIFQELTIPDIVKRVFRDHGFTDFTERLSGSYDPLEYCVQYRETDLNFVTRLMERAGIYYYFTHDNGRHVLVLCDSPGAHDPYPGFEQIYFNLRTEAQRGSDEISQWTVSKQVQPGAYATTAFDFTTPRKSLGTRSSISADHANGAFEVFDFPGEYTEYSAGEAVAKLRMEELAALHELASGAGDARGIAAGFVFSLKDAPRDDQERKYLVLTATHHFTLDPYVSGTAGGGDELYHCSFTAIDASVPYRPARLTPKPVVQGPQTAIIVGKQGEEIWTDKHGRIKAQFHWDRYGKADENSSCWIRVAQVWAGKKWGGMFVPRIGQEVIVEFLEGDPDQPLVTGRVYNGACMPPYDLPANATRSTLKSLSSKGGGGFNEIRFEDKKGSEQLFVHAERDHDLRVKNDTKEWVGNDRHLIVKADQMEQVQGDKHLAVKGDQNEKVDGTVSLKTGMDLQQKVGMKHALDAGMEIHLKAGMNVVIEAGMSITLKAGGGFVTVGPAGVAISGTPVLINSGGAAGSGSGASPDAPTAPKEAEKGDAGEKDEAAQAPRPPKPTQFSAAATTMKQAAKDGSAFVPGGAPV